MEDATAFLAGSEDGIARLWSCTASSNEEPCLRSFVGHEGAVTAVDVVDRVTVLTGSVDSHVRVWDAISTTCLRTYVDHTKRVTDISVAYDDFTFITSSADRTIKMWVITSVPKKKHQEEEAPLETLLESNEFMTCN